MVVAWGRNERLSVVVDRFNGGGDSFVAGVVERRALDRDTVL